ncbi:MAG: hypothetical protein IT372_35660 [Polyangiaceae bacterium]|nr:hypothetical protein [Polyangiaceae bacterium]
MQTRARAGWVVTAALSCVLGCAAAPGPEARTGAEARAGTAAATDTGAGTDADTGTAADAAADTDTGAGTAAGAGASAGASAAMRGGWISAPPEAPYQARARTLQARGPILIGEPAPPPEPTRPRKRGRVAVSLNGADLENACRLLADAGRFNLVVQSGLTGTVSATLDGVDPYDALVAIAEANGAEVRFERGIVIVRRPGK